MPLDREVQLNRCIVLFGAVFTVALFSPNRVVTSTRAGASMDVNTVAPLAAHLNYFVGPNSARWRTNIPTFERVRDRDVFDGIDVVFYGRDQVP